MIELPVLKYVLLIASVLFPLEIAVCINIVGFGGCCL
jgi:hypothetical protein